MREVLERARAIQGQIEKEKAAAPLLKKAERYLQRYAVVVVSSAMAVKCFTAERLQRI